ncbi:MAG TPA: RNA polymerase sigma factor [Gemmatimonadales bacterium]
MTTPSDRALVEALTSHGDERAFAALYARHTPALYGLALRLSGGNEADAQDMAHDAWVRAVERGTQFEWRSAYRSWLCGIVVNLWRERTRAQRRAPDQPIEDLTIGTQDARLAGAVDRVTLEHAVLRLPAGYREVLVLHDIQGYTHEEIGALLDIEPGTSKSQLARARASLRRALGVAEGA